MRTALLACLGCLAGMVASPAWAQGAPPADQGSDGNGADQVVGLFGATCLHFSGDPTATRAFLQEQKAPERPATAGTTFHQTSTCMMGPGPKAVVDTELKVKGLDGLRVIDASVMPTVVSGNTNATVIMIAEKGADMILRAA